MSTNLFHDVRTFSIVGGSPTFDIDPQRLLTLSYQLVEEEVVKEFLPALEKYQLNPTLENLEEAVDGAVDSIYVLAFFLNQMGLDSQQHWDVVQAANMAKYPNGKVLRNPQTQKIMKPEGWRPPEHMSLLIEWWSRQRKEGYKGGLIQHLDEGKKV